MRGTFLIVLAWLVAGLALPGSNAAGPEPPTGPVVLTVTGHLAGREAGGPVLSFPARSPAPAGSSSRWWATR